MGLGAVAFDDSFCRLFDPKAHPQLVKQGGLLYPTVNASTEIHATGRCDPFPDVPVPA